MYASWASNNSFKVFLGCLIPAPLFQSLSQIPNPCSTTIIYVIYDIYITPDPYSTTIIYVIYDIYIFKVFLKYLIPAPLQLSMICIYIYIYHNNSFKVFPEYLKHKRRIRFKGSEKHTKRNDS